MEVGQLVINHPELKTRGDHESGFRAARSHQAPFRSSAFECSHNRGTDRPNAAFPLANFRDRCRGCFGDFKPLRMHVVPSEILDFDRLEGPGADFEIQSRDAHVQLLELLQDLSGEMQTRGRRGDTPFLLSVDRLISDLVIRIGVPLDVRRERKPAQPLNRFLGIITPIFRALLRQFVPRAHLQGERVLQGLEKPVEILEDKWGTLLHHIFLSP